MGQFQASKQKEGDRLVISLSGSIDEDAVLLNVNFESCKEVVLNLEKITAINSCGIREWIKWLKAEGTSSVITFKNCPKIIVDQINMVAGFLPSNAVVESFYVPYFNEESGNEKMILFNKGKEFTDAGVKPPDEVKDTNGSHMEMDVIEAKYFKFLKKSA